MQIFNAGVFTVGYHKGFLRRIKYGDVEVIRMIYMALRDQNWNTYEPIIQHEEIEKLENGFTIRYDCFYQNEGKIIFKWRVVIMGLASGEITYEIHGEAVTDILKNRAGLCILHPIAHTAGSQCELHHADGSETKSKFPSMIAAENPFKNLRAFRWKCSDSWYSLHYEGDIFETEDQRNWCDASYKTFCTPLEIPFPVLLKTGHRVYQKVAFKPDDRLPHISYIKDKPIEIMALDGTFALPKIGVAASTEANTLSQANISAIRDLNLHHYRIDVMPSQKNWIEKFKIDCKMAADLGLQLELAIHIAKKQDLESIQRAWSEVKPVVAHIILLDPYSPAATEHLINEVEAARVLFQSTLIGAGTDYNFRELNVSSFNSAALDFISYSIDPQEHAIDDLTIMENISAQANTVQSARALHGPHKPVYISSLTLKKRFNPAATVPADKILPNEKKSDPRQLTNFAAAFTLGSIKSLSMARANSITCFQTAGGQGILSLQGEAYPVYNILREISSIRNPWIINTISSDPLTADAVAFSDGESCIVMLVNYTAAGQLLVFKDKKYVLGPYEVKKAIAE